MRSLNSKMALYNVYQLKHIQFKKHMQYCKQHIYDEYYTAQWNFIIFRKLSHMTVTSPNQK